MSADVRVGQVIQPDQFGMPQYTVKPRRRRRWWLITLTIIIAFVCLWWFWPRHDRILDLAAELDQRDPGWRWDELRVSKPSLPEAENAMPTLIRIGNAVPAASAPGRPSLTNKNIARMGWTQIGTDLAWTEPAEQLNDALSKELASELQLTESVRKQLPDLLRFKTTQFELPPFSAKLLQGPPWVPNSLMKLSHLLSIDLEETVQGNNSQEAQKRALLLIHGLKLYGDIGAINYGEHFRNVTYCCQRLERVLAHFEVNQDALRALQDEINQIDLMNQFKQWLRFQRALAFAVFDAYINHLDESLQGRTATAWVRLQFGLSKNDFIEGQTLLVEYLTHRLDQLNGVPSAQVKMDGLLQRIGHNQPKNNNELQRTWDNFMHSGTMRVYYQISQVSHHVEPALQQAQAAQQVMIAAIAAERFRLKNGRWPNDLHELVPAFLAEVPKDPCSPGNELSWKVTPTGRVVYSVGLNGMDDGGNCEWLGQDVMVDIGFRLFDQRVQPKAKSSAQ